MVGSVWEWTTSSDDDDVAESGAGVGDFEALGVWLPLRGGSWNSNSSSLDVRCDSRYRNNAYNFNHGRGFRLFLPSH